MAKIIRRGGVGALALAVIMAAAPVVRAQNQTANQAASALPDRERELTGLLLDARKQYVSSHAATAAKDARIAMQIRVLGFMRQSQDAQDWVGTVKSRGTTPDGDGWIVIEIADGVTVATWQSKEEDRNAETLFRPNSALSKASEPLSIGQRVAFSATFIRAVLADDAQMVNAPQFIVRFKTLKPVP